MYGFTENEYMKNRTGPFNVLCLDISESMSKGAGWEQATKFISEFLKGKMKKRGPFILLQNVKINSLSGKVDRSNFQVKHIYCQILNIYVM